MRKKWMLPFVLVATVVSAQNQAPADDIYQAVRTNALPALRSLIGAQGVNTQNRDGYTPLVLATAFGSLDAMQLLVDGGADVNLPAASGITPLHVAARDARKVRLLLARGAKVNVASLSSSTPLIVAASTSGASESIRQLLDHGADVKPADRNGLTALLTATLLNESVSAKMILEAGGDPRANGGVLGTPLMAAAINGNAELTRLYLERKADINAVSADSDGIVKNGQVQFGRVTALHMAAAGQSPEVVKLLLDRGATVDPRDIRGMTPLMFAVSTDHPVPEIIKLLRARGADPLAKSTIGETTLDWARKFNDPAVLRVLGLAHATVAEPAGSLAEGPRLDVRSAVEHSLPLLRTASARVQSDGGCVACHAQPLTAMAATLAEGRGWRADGPITAGPQQELSLAGAATNLLQPVFQGGSPDGQTYGGLMLAIEHANASMATDALAYYLAAIQHREGNWHGRGVTRAPMQDGDIPRTVFAVRVLAEFATPALKDEFADRIARAVNWLSRQAPAGTQDQAMQVLGLAWGHAAADTRKGSVKALVALQRPNGGWGQTPHLAADAYATGEALYALHESGIPVPDTVFARGTMFLLRTQQSDGSWHVVNRAMKLQPYFESGFPYGHDQWISQAGTAWATMALTSMPSMPQPPAVARK